MYWVRHKTKKNERSMTVASFQNLKRSYDVVGHYNPDTKEVTPLSENPNLPQPSKSVAGNAGVAAGEIGDVNPNDNDGDLLNGAGEDEPNEGEGGQEEEGEGDDSESTVNAPDPKDVDAAIEDKIAEDQFGGEDKSKKSGVPKAKKPTRR